MEHIVKHFERMGALAKAYEGREMWGSSMARIDVRKEPLKGLAYFNIALRIGTKAKVIHVEPTQRHLLLQLERYGEKAKFLCGHDERAWFVAAIPEEARGVTNVTTAMEALKPTEVKRAQTRAKLSRAARRRRANAAYIRQGEWFFIPTPNLVVPSDQIVKNRPIRRGNGKAHMVAEEYHVGGDQVWTHRTLAPNGVSDEEMNNIYSREKAAGRVISRMGWARMVRDMETYARGTVRHPDHKTITLKGWHRVVMNTETKARAMANVAFLD